MKMPKRRSRVDLFPNIADARDWCVKEGELFDFRGKLRGISIGHHHPDVVTDEIDIFVPEALNQLMDIDGGSFLVIASFFSGRLAEAAQVRRNYCVVFAKGREQRQPHSGVVTEAMNQHQRRFATAGLKVVDANAINICKKGFVVSFGLGAGSAGLNIFCSSWPVTGDLKNDRFFTGLREMCDIRRFGIETSGGQGL